jgi:hypothetical protein
MAESKQKRFFHTKFITETISSLTDSTLKKISRLLHQRSNFANFYQGHPTSSAPLSESGTNFFAF